MCACLEMFDTYLLSASHNASDAVRIVRIVMVRGFHHSMC